MGPSGTGSGHTVPAPRHSASALTQASASVTAIPVPCHRQPVPHNKA